MTHGNLLTSGIVLLTVVAIAWGGVFLLRVVGGTVAANDLQRSSFRAGHAHAGVLVILGLVIQLLTSQTGVPAWANTLGTGVLFAAILMPLGFFLSVLGQNPQRRNAWKYAIAAGGVSLVVGVVGAGTGLLIAGL